MSNSLALARLDFNLRDGFLVPPLLKNENIGEKNGIQELSRSRTFHLDRRRRQGACVDVRGRSLILFSESCGEICGNHSLRVRIVRVRTSRRRLSHRARDERRLPRWSDPRSRRRVRRPRPVRLIFRDCARARALRVFSRVRPSSLSFRPSFLPTKRLEQLHRAPHQSRRSSSRARGRSAMVETSSHIVSHSIHRSIASLLEYESKPSLPVPSRRVPGRQSNRHRPSSTPRASGIDSSTHAPDVIRSIIARPSLIPRSRRSTRARAHSFPNVPNVPNESIDDSIRLSRASSRDAPARRLETTTCVRFVLPSRPRVRRLSRRARV